MPLLVTRAGWRITRHQQSLLPMLYYKLRIDHANRPSRRVTLAPPPLRNPCRWIWLISPELLLRRGRRLEWKSYRPLPYNLINLPRRPQYDGRFYIDAVSSKARMACYDAAPAKIRSVHGVDKDVTLNRDRDHGGNKCESNGLTVWCD
jgi:hypothetical protein